MDEAAKTAASAQPGEAADQTQAATATTPRPEENTGVPIPEPPQPAEAEAEPATGAANETPATQEAKPAEETQKSSEPEPEDPKKKAHDMAVAIVAEALKPDGPPDPLEPFFSLCAHGTVDEVRAAVEAGADVNARNFAGSMPLHRAVTNNGYDVVKYLVDAGADVNARTTGQYRDTVLHSAIWTKDSRVIALLLERGADPYALDSRQWTPVHLAAYHMRSPEILGLLVEAMQPLEPTPGKRYKGVIEFVDSPNRRAYQLVDGHIVVHNLRRVGRGIFLGHLVSIQYHVSAKSRASVENITLKEADAAAGIKLPPPPK